MELWHHPHHTNDTPYGAPNSLWCCYPIWTTIAHPLPAATCLLVATACFCCRWCSAGYSLAPVMLPEETLFLCPSASAMGPVKRGPMIRDAVGQFVHDVPSPKPEPFLDNVPLHWVGDALRYVASPWSSRGTVLLLADHRAYAAFSFARPASHTIALAKPSNYTSPSFHILFSCVAPIFGYSLFAIPLSSTPCLEPDRHMSYFFNRFIFACHTHPKSGHQRPRNATDPMPWVEKETTTRRRRTIIISNGSR